MLVLSRRLNQAILFPGIETTVEVVDIKAGQVRLGITAPPQVRVLRGEVKERPADPPVERTAPAVFPTPELNRMLQNRLHIASIGLDHLRRQLQAGFGQDAEATLAALEEDLRLLRQRLRDELTRIARPLADGAGRARKALLVEDNANERELLASFLRQAGLEVDTAGDGSDALDYLRQRGRPDVLLLDMGLPRCDGATTVRHIRREPSLTGLKIIAVSGHTPDEFDLASGPNGVDRWFQKPVDPAALIQQLSRELGALPC
jgi:carbon storage regulator CsrA